MSGITLSAKEQHMLSTFISLLEEMPKVDWEKMAPLVGHKYGRNVRPAFQKIWEKLKGGAEEGTQGNDNGAGDGADDNDALPITTPKKPTPKKRVGASANPRKASAGGPRTPKKVKTKQEKEEEAKLDAEKLKDEDCDGDSDHGILPDAPASEGLNSKNESEDEPFHSSQVDEENA